jgi:rubrerythrin
MVVNIYPTLMKGLISGYDMPSYKSNQSIICPHCGYIVEEDTKISGFSVICPKCKAVFLES